jgi:hypothetical protein
MKQNKPDSVPYLNGEGHDDNDHSNTNNKSLKNI